MKSAMPQQHRYKTTVTWTGNIGAGTKSYGSYQRTYTIRALDKPVVEGSSDPVFRGDPGKYNPEDLLVASISACHMLWYLHLCSEAGVIVEDYSDTATGIMVETPDGGGYFIEVILNPVVTVKMEEMVATANSLHCRASECCFITNSVNFPVRHNPSARTRD